MAFDGLRKIRCPFCAKEYRLGEFAVYNGNNGTTKEASKGVWGQINATPLDGKKNVLDRTRRKCPNAECGHLLPFNSEYVDQNITIAVIGDSDSGKSHFIAAAIKQMKERYGIPPAVGLSGFNAADSDIDTYYERIYYDPLFKRNEPLAFTVPAQKPLDEPLIYEMRIGERRINLLIYDASGEDIALIDTRISNKPHILNAQALIFLADPYSMSGFVDQLSHHLRPPNGIRQRLSADVLNTVIEIFKRANGSTRDPQFSIPVAVALSKSDLIPYVVTRSGNPLYPMLADPQYPSQLTREESDGIHTVVRQLLLEVGAYSLVSMEQFIERLNFSAISATGIALDDSTGKYPQVTPHRCLDPLFWVLRELEIFP